MNDTALLNGLTMWYDLQALSTPVPEIAWSALASMRRHLWILCPDLVVLALFDDDISIAEK